MSGVGQWSRDGARNHICYLVRRLNAELGAPLVARLAGVEGENWAVYWEDLEASPPEPEVQLRLLRAHTVFYGIAQDRGEPAAREWMVEPNGLLRGSSPVEAVSQDRFKEVAQAAKSFLEVSA